MATYSDIKQVLLTGAAATEISGKNEKKTRQKRNGGNHPSQSPSIPSIPQVASFSHVPSAPSAPPAPSAPLAPSFSPAPASSTRSTRSTSSIPSAPAITSVPSAPSAPSAPSVPSTEGGTRTIKVELKKRTTAKRVHLQPKRSDILKGGKKPATVQTKRARKVTLAVHSLHKRMKRAKKMTRKVKEMSLEQLREHLIQKKLIKSTSKAPKSVLCQIAADAQIVAGKAL